MDWRSQRTPCPTSALSAAPRLLSLPLKLANLLEPVTVGQVQKCTAWTQTSGILQSLMPDRSHLLELCCELVSVVALCCARNHSWHAGCIADLPSRWATPLLSLDSHQFHASIHADVQHHLEDHGQAREPWKTTRQWFPVEKCFVPVGAERITTQTKTVLGHHFIFSFCRGKYAT